jgi:hypothetical protein
MFQFDLTLRAEGLGLIKGRFVLFKVILNLGFDWSLEICVGRCGFFKGVGLV